jgi:hypothetical protein
LVIVGFLVGADVGRARHWLHYGWPGGGVEGAVLQVFVWRAWAGICNSWYMVIRQPVEKMSINRMHMQSQ